MILLVVYTVMSLATFTLYGIDKRRAAAGRLRIRESTLHVMELLGGWPGALIAQHAFRHKRWKRSYMGVFWVIAGSHTLFWGAWLAFR